MTGLPRPYVLPEVKVALPARGRGVRPGPMLAVGLGLIVVTAAAGISATSGDHVPRPTVALPSASPAPSAVVPPSIVDTPIATAEPSATPASPEPNPAQPEPANPPKPPPTTAPAPPPPAPAKGKAISGRESGKCLRATGGDGSPVVLWTCNGSAAQQWVFAGDGTVRNGGLCLDAAGGSTANGTVVQLATCSGNPAQQFRLNAAHDLINVQADKCADARGHGTADGTAIQLWSCAGTNNQKWDAF